MREGRLRGFKKAERGTKRLQNKNWRRSKGKKKPKAREEADIDSVDFLICVCGARIKGIAREDRVDLRKVAGNRRQALGTSPSASCNFVWRRFTREEGKNLRGWRARLQSDRIWEERSSIWRQRSW
jgi:hypothetical protein